jgi:hypothetical protein
MVDFILYFLNSTLHLKCEQSILLLFVLLRKFPRVRAEAHQRAVKLFPGDAKKWTNKNDAELSLILEGNIKLQTNNLIRKVFHL